ncbi:MAG: integrase arm-type DNA-binding domain-containing protein [Acidobacteriota bacterium]
MPSIRFSDRKLASLKATERIVDYMDEALAGFGLRVLPSGRKTFFVRYRIRANRRRDKIGEYGSKHHQFSLGEARKEAMKVLGAVARGRDPHRDTSLSVGEMAAAWMEAVSGELKDGGREDRRILKHDVLPHWRDIPAKEISRADVRDLIQIPYDRGAPTMSNRLRALISRLWNWGLERDLVDTNPTVGVRKLAKERAGQRVLTHSEIRDLWKVLELEGGSMAAVFQALLLTGQRPIEVRTAELRQIDGHRWTIPGSVAKNGIEHRVHLSDFALEVFIEKPERERGERYVFPSWKKAGSCVSSINKACGRYVELSGLDWFTPRDVRRTFVTGLGELGIDPVVRAACVNHSIPTVTHRNYDRWHYEPQKREAFELWTRHVRELTLLR